jgi:hypothetical protein
MRWVVITPLGCRVEPEVKRNLAMVSGPSSACAASSSPRGEVASRLSKLRTARPSMPPSASTTVTSSGTVASMARAYCGPLAKTSPGVELARIWRNLPKSCETNEYAVEIGT